MELDYEKLGFKCGVEIHQELNTKKLFCSCESSMKEEKKTFEIRRQLRSVAGETGEVDTASHYEELRERVFVYSGYENEACLVETDSEPPHPVDKEALEICLGFAKALHMKVPDTLCVMRKTVTDGSACSGFQRTILAGIESKDSFLPKSKVKVNQLNLEEDACKIMKKEDNVVYYSLSRLGIPLLEIGTTADIKDPEHAKEAAAEIGSILRSFNVKRGIGTIRQDVNVSIKGGARIEVKGWQDLKTIPLLVENEVLRQIALLEIKKELEKRGLKKFDNNIANATNAFEKTDNKIISKIIRSNGRVLAILLPKFAGLLKKEVCPGKTFGRELSEYAKAYGTKGMIHTDEDLKKYGLEKEFDKIKKQMKAGKDDLVIIIAENENIAKKAAESVYERALYCLTGVPEETRIPNHKDATSSYARPLPGAHRLYPETDIPMVQITQKIMDSIKVPEMMADKIARLGKLYKIDAVTLKEMQRDGIDIEDYAKKYKKIEPKYIAQVLIEYPKEIKKRYNIDVDAEKYADELFTRLSAGEINKDAVLEIFAELGKGNKVDYSKFAVMDEKALEKEIKIMIQQNKDAPVNAMMGIVMGRLRGKAPGKTIAEIIKRLMS
ncbi:MAG: Glu-tRNA(Gln) amidotransferase subunit GatE [Nanoarchaeota archaeon]|nr:Glu-tRNA(Gln) amidotransferase subunit GatE [Nanoarchaeota archaeon]